MSIEGHLSELERRHEQLEREIEEKNASPSVDQLEVAKLKRKKLRLKEEIEQLRSREVA